MTQQKPSVGRIVHYRLSGSDVDQINAHDPIDHTGVRPQHRNPVHEGDVYPATVVRVFSPDPASTVANLQVHLDGRTNHWATSRSEGEQAGNWFWPPRV